MAAQTITVQFHDQSLTAAVIDDKPYVAMKPICENIGLQWEGQHQRIKRHPVLSATMCMTHIVAEDGKQREMLMLPLDYLNGWLFGIDVSRVKEALRPRLLEYQRECFNVLADYFLPKARGGSDPRTRKALPGGLTPEQQDAIKALVRGRIAALPKDKQAQAAVACWSSIKSKLKVKSYKQAPPEAFPQICSLIARLPLEGELLPKQEENPCALSELDMAMLYRFCSDAITLCKIGREMKPVLDALHSIALMNVSPCLHNNRLIVSHFMARFKDAMEDAARKNNVFVGKLELPKI